MSSRVLNSPTVRGAATVEVEKGDSPPDSTKGTVPLFRPIGLMAKRHGGALYVFAVGMQNAEATGKFRVRGVPAGARVEVLGENRSLPLRLGTFEDRFTPYAVHLYRIR